MIIPLSCFDGKFMAWPRSCGQPVTPRSLQGWLKLTRHGVVEPPSQKKDMRKSYDACFKVG